MSYTNLLYHIVIRTKRSQRTIDEAYERELYAFILTYVKNRNSVLYRINGMPDHVHILVGLHPSVAISDFMRELKTATSKMMKASRTKFPMFEGWESEYYASTVSRSHQEAVRQYIMCQKEHHKKANLRDELIILCKKNGISFNEEYI